MAFRNSILAGEELIRTGIRSANYVVGVAGWRVDRDGNAEFNEVTVRGQLIAGTYPAGPYVYVTPDLDPGPDAVPGIAFGTGIEFSAIYRAVVGAFWIASTDGIVLSPDGGFGSGSVTVIGSMNVDDHVLLDAAGNASRAVQGWFGAGDTADGSPAQSPAAETYKTVAGRAALAPIAAGTYYTIPINFPAELLGCSLLPMSNATPVFCTANNGGAGSPVSDSTGLRFRVWNTATGAQFIGNLTILWTAQGY